MSAKRTRTMYMHTLDGKPATGIWYRAGHVMWVATPHQRIRLEDSLAAVRKTQARCVEHAEYLGDGYEEWAIKSRYGYVLVEVPQ